MATLTAEPAIWSMLDYSQLYDRDPERNAQRRYWALQAMKALAEGHNVAIDADTGTGKTIMMILIHLGLEWNTICCVPTVELAYQHQKLFKKLLGHTRGTLVMTGNKSPAERAKLWHDTNIKLVFGTPHVFINDLRRRTFPTGHFALLVNDESHHTRYRYPSVPLSRAAHQAGAIILSLSATPDDKLAKVNCFVTKTIKADIKMPKKDFVTDVTQPTARLDQANASLQELLTTTTDELSDLGLVPESINWLTNHQLDMALEKAAQLLYPNNYQGTSAVARYHYLNYLEHVLNDCSYPNFAWAAKRLYQKADTYANWIINHPRFNELYTYVLTLVEGNEIHPKINSLLRIVKYRFDNYGDTFIVFVNEKETGDYLTEILCQQNLKFDTAYGGPAHKHIKEVRALLETNALDGVVASSVLNEGVALPNVDTIINYGPAQTRVEWEQRAGRAGRGIKPGTIISMIVNRRKAWAMEKKTRPPKIIKPSLPRSNTLWLFPAEEMLPTVNQGARSKSWNLALYLEK